MYPNAIYITNDGISFTNSLTQVISHHLNLSNYIVILGGRISSVCGLDACVFQRPYLNFVLRIIARL